MPLPEGRDTVWLSWLPKITSSWMVCSSKITSSWIASSPPLHHHPSHTLPNQVSVILPMLLPSRTCRARTSHHQLPLLCQAPRHAFSENFSFLQLACSAHSHLHQEFHVATVTSIPDQLFNIVAWISLQNIMGHHHRSPQIISGSPPGYTCAGKCGNGAGSLYGFPMNWFLDKCTHQRWPHFVLWI